MTWQIWLVTYNCQHPNNRAAPERTNMFGWLQKLSASGERERYTVAKK
jgi:hypothetical protein